MVGFIRRETYASLAAIRHHSRVDATERTRAAIQLTATTRTSDSAE
jgi:hypothetical protein